MHVRIPRKVRVVARGVPILVLLDIREKTVRFQALMDELRLVGYWAPLPSLVEVPCHPPVVLRLCECLEQVLDPEPNDGFLVTSC